MIGGGATRCTAAARTGTRDAPCCSRCAGLASSHARLASASSSPRAGRLGRPGRGRPGPAHQLPLTGHLGRAADAVRPGRGGRRRRLPRHGGRARPRGGGGGLRRRAVPAVPGRRHRPGEPELAGHLPEPEPLRGRRGAGRDPGRRPPPPAWKTVAHGGHHAWHDHRIHFMGKDPSVVAGLSEGRPVEWSGGVPFTVDGDAGGRPTATTGCSTRRARCPGSP